jgi:hypothetical protein
MGDPISVQGQAVKSRNPLARSAFANVNSGIHLEQYGQKPQDSKTARSTGRPVSAVPVKWSMPIRSWHQVAIYSAFGGRDRGCGSHVGYRSCRSRTFHDSWPKTAAPAIPAVPVDWCWEIQQDVGAPQRSAEFDTPAHIRTEIAKLGHRDVVDVVVAAFDAQLGIETPLDIRTHLARLGQTTGYAGANPIC